MGNKGVTKGRARAKGSPAATARRLRFAVSLANETDVEEWDADTLARFREDLERFLVKPGGGPQLIPRQQYGAESAETISLLQAHTRAMLDDFVAEGRALLAVEPGDLAAGGLIVEVLRDDLGRAALGTVVGPLVPVYRLSLAFLLTSAGGVGRCEPTCRKYFVRTGRREYCSEQCRSRVAQRAFRERRFKPTRKGTK
jgi:hypothetical protein